MVNARARAVASNDNAKPSVTVLIDFSSISGVTPEMAPVIPKTVPKKPKMGIAQVINRVKPKLPSNSILSASAKFRS